jgi:hypothetical protein
MISKKAISLQIAVVLACFLFYTGSGAMITSLRNGTITGHYPNIHLIMH